MAVPLFRRGEEGGKGGEGQTALPDKGLLAKPERRPDQAQAARVQVRGAYRLTKLHQNFHQVSSSYHCVLICSPKGLHGAYQPLLQQQAYN